MASREKQKTKFLALLSDESYCPQESLQVFILILLEYLMPHYLLRHSRKCNSTKVKCTFVQALRLCTGRTAHGGSKGILYPFVTMALEGDEGSA